MGWHRPVEALMICSSKIEGWKRDVLVPRFPSRLWKLEWGNLLWRPSDLLYPGTCVGTGFQPCLLSLNVELRPVWLLGVQMVWAGQSFLDFICNTRTRGLSPIGTRVSCSTWILVQTEEWRCFSVDTRDFYCSFSNGWRKLYECFMIIPALQERGPVTIV